MMHAKSLFYLALFLAVSTTLLLSSCSKTTVVLLKNPAGEGDGHLIVENAAGSVVITKENEATTVAGAGARPTPPAPYTEEKISRQFGAALAILPEPPKHFTLYFTPGATGLSEGSKAQIPEILKTIEQRSARDLSVVGHTGIVGNPAANLRLSQKRALVIRKLLIDHGVAPDHIQVTSHGPKNPLVKAEAAGHESKNSRVEVVVR